MRAATDITMVDSIFYMLIMLTKARDPIVQSTAVESVLHNV